MPFVAYTGEPLIGQLDIIAHQSFKELLSNEDVLVQFGLDEAVTDEGRKKFRQKIKGAVGGSDDSETTGPTTGSGNVNGTDDSPDENEGNGGAGGSASGVTGSTGGSATDDSDGTTPSDSPQAPSVGITILDDNDGGQEQLPFGENVKVARNPRYADVEYYFPSTKASIVDPPINVFEIKKQDIEDAAKRITATGDVLHRKQIEKDLKKSKLIASDTVSAEVESPSVVPDEARRQLTSNVANSGKIPLTAGNLKLIENYLVRSFMSSAVVKKWTMKSLVSASTELTKLVDEFVADVKKNRKTEYDVTPINMPKEDERYLGFGAKIFDPIDNQKDFIKGAPYRGWGNSLFEVESFDSYSGEYLLAKLLLTSPHIKWWQRLHGEVQIAYNGKDNYKPDFVPWMMKACAGSSKVRTKAVVPTKWFKRSAKLPRTWSISSLSKTLLRASTGAISLLTRTT